MQIFDNAMKVLQHTGDLVLVDGDAIILPQSVTKFTQFLSNMLLPFVTGYWVRTGEQTVLLIDRLIDRLIDQLIIVRGA